MVYISMHSQNEDLVDGQHLTWKKKLLLTVVLLCFKMNEFDGYVYFSSPEKQLFDFLI